jgi:hypothetical protein
MTCANCQALQQGVAEVERELQRTKLTLTGCRELLSAIRLALNHADLEHEPELSAIRDELNITGEKA